MNSAVRNYFSIGMIALASSALLGCLPEDDFQDLEVMAPSPKVSLPLLNTNLSLSNLINTDGDGNHLIENEDKSYSLKYKTSMASPPVSAFFPEIPSQSYSKNFSLGYNAPGLYSDSVTASFQDDIPLDLNELAIYKIEPKAGGLNFNMASTYEHDVKVKLMFPNIINKQTGAPLTEVFYLRAWNRQPLSRNIPLAEHIIKIKENMLSYEMEVTIYGGTGNAISSSQGITFDFGMSDIVFSYMEGNFANISVPIAADTLLIPAFNSAVSGDIALLPILNMSFENSFGTNISADLSRISISSKNGQMTRLTDEGSSQFFGGNFVIASPGDRKDIASTYQKIDKANSNIENAFSSIPDGIFYDLGFVLGSTKNDTSFVSENSKIGIDIETEIPLEGRFKLLMADTMAVDFQDFSQSVEELKVLIKTENSFPIDAYLQIYFLDEHGNMLTDTQGEPLPLFKDMETSEGARFLRAAAIINTTTGATQPEKVDMPIAATISDSQILAKAKHLLIQAQVRSTEQANTIKLYSFYNIRFSMAMQMKASL